MTDGSKQHRSGKFARDARHGEAATLAVQALTYLAGEPERLSRFLALTGLDPASIRAAAEQPGFLAGVLEHIAADEALLLAFAAEADISPGEVGKARAALAGRVSEPDTA